MVPREGGNQDWAPAFAGEQGSRRPKVCHPSESWDLRLGLPPRVKRETPAFAGVTVCV
ncbi:conserved hypothetical protein [Sphingomonas aurantiaca]|uniref:Uncharacterized protein n=1 Tax=Sphingomonas aurantiaca TaxID=185949 RepID=A0A5E7YH42_9SPHN|nr:conserved hypothetical protein [Sphingomonas aurantiaca]